MDADVVQLSVTFASPAVPLALVAPEGDALSIVSALVFVSLPACVVAFPAHAVTGAVMAYAAPVTAGIKL